VVAAGAVDLLTGRRPVQRFVYAPLGIQPRRTDMISNRRSLSSYSHKLEYALLVVVLVAMALWLAV
jgi:hypothetical protein